MRHTPRLLAVFGVAWCLVVVAGTATFAAAATKDGVPLGLDDASAWGPMAGSLSASRAIVDGRDGLRMPCHFAGTDIERASWDCKADLDLAAAKGLRFLFFCSNPAPVSHFNVYFRSGKGWYTATLSDIVPGKWNTIFVKKVQTRTEGTPEGWRRIDTVRLSAWRLGDENTEFYVTDFAALGADAPVALVLAESAAREAPGEARAAQNCAETAAQYLDDLGLPYAVVSDVDLTPAQLTKTRLLVLPYSPAMSPETTDTLASFIERGGKLVAFYTLPSRLESIVSLERGQYVKQPYPGYFSSIRPAEGVLNGMPAIVNQSSGNIGGMKPIPGRSRVAAYWYDDKGASTDQPAILVSNNCAFMTHILLPDDPDNKRLMFLAMIGHFVPDYWRQAAATRLDALGRIGPFADFDALQLEVNRRSRGENATRDIATAGELRARAVRLLEQEAFPESVTAANEAQRFVTRAYCGIQQPYRGEHRAFWCHDAFGVAGMEWDEAIRILAENGFTAILPNMLWGGTAYYNSDVLPVAPEVTEKGDPLAACLKACKKYGVACHVWKVNWNTGGRAPREFVEHMKKAGRTQVSFDGAAQDSWLCPSHPQNQQLEIDAMVEVATKYDVDGIHFDYIRYPGSDACFCPGCRTRFEQAAGRKVARWPSDVRTAPDLREQWLDFRRSQITGVVAAVSRAVRAAKPRVRISAAVFPNWPKDRDSIGQDWRLWCRNGYLDFVCPMDYSADNTSFDNLVREQVTWAGNTPCYPGIGLSVWPDGRDIVKLIEQIGITRRYKTGGFTVFNYGVPEAREVLPLCGLGITRREPR